MFFSRGGGGATFCHLFETIQRLYNGLSHIVVPINPIFLMLISDFNGQSVMSLGIKSAFTFTHVRVVFELK